MNAKQRRVFDRAVARHVKGDARGVRACRRAFLARILGSRARERPEAAAAAEAASAPAFRGAARRAATAQALARFSSGRFSARIESLLFSPPSERPPPQLLLGTPLRLSQDTRRVLGAPVLQVEAGAHAMVTWTAPFDGYVRACTWTSTVGREYIATGAVTANGVRWGYALGPTRTLVFDGERLRIGETIHIEYVNGNGIPVLLQAALHVDVDPAPASG